MISVLVPIDALAIQGSLKAAKQAKKTVVRFEVKNDGALFMKDVARLCLSSPDSKIEAVKDGEFKLTEFSTVCAKEIQSLAAQWEAKPKEMATVNMKTPDDRPNLEEKILDKYPEGIKVDEVNGCPCLLLKGKQAREAAAP